MKTFLGVITALVGSFMYVLMSVCSKHLSQTVEVYDILILQSYTGLICSFIFLKQKKYNWHTIIYTHNIRYAIRSLISLGSIYTLLIALQSVTVFNALVILNTAPLVIPLLRKVFYKKIISYQSMFIATFGFIGIVLILSPNKALFDFSILLVICSMLCVAFSLLILENMPKYDPNLMVFYYFFYSSILLTADQLIRHHLFYPSASQLFFGALIGAMFFIVQCSIIQAARFISSQLIAVLFYSEVILSLLFSVYFENMAMTRYLLVGTLLVIFAGIHVIFLEHNMQQKNTEHVD